METIKDESGQIDLKSKGQEGCRKIINTRRER